MSTANSPGCDDQRALEPAAEVFPAVQFREMRPADIPAGLRLCRASRWNQVGRDWEQFLHLEPHGAVVAAREERIVGTVATLRYGARFGWVAWCRSIRPSGAEVSGPGCYAGGFHS